jgi:hypothetical protein
MDSAVPLPLSTLQLQNVGNAATVAQSTLQLQNVDSAVPEPQSMLQFQNVDNAVPVPQSTRQLPVPNESKVSTNVALYLCIICEVPFSCHACALFVLSKKKLCVRMPNFVLVSRVGVLVLNYGRLDFVATTAWPLTKFR